MTIAGQGGKDLIRSILTNVIHFVKRKQTAATTQLCDGRILMMHYKYTFWMCLGLFSTVWYSWYHKDSMVCVSHYNADSQVGVDYLNLCMSYNTYYDPVEEETKNIMFYRWIPISILFIGLINYIPRKLSKYCDDTKPGKFMDSVATKRTTFDSRGGEQVVDHIVRFLAKYQKTHNHIFYHYFLCNVVALVLDICCLFVLDFFLQGRFITYGLTNVYNRDPQFFTDSMSRTFPPFTLCTITPTMRLTAQRTEVFGCHLTLMELYEKVFFILWWWMVIAILSTTIYIIFLFLMTTLPYVRHFLIKFVKPDSAKVSETHISVTATVNKVLEKCDIGEVYLLYRLKALVSPVQFCDILMKLEPLLKISEEKYEQILPTSNKQMDPLLYSNYTKIQQLE